MSDTLVYPYRRGSLYINLTNECGNSCLFCARSHRIFRLGQFDLGLTIEHGIDEYQQGIDSHIRDRGKPREFVFCGYGEPTTRIRALLDLSQWIQKEYGGVIRLNTNGQTGLMWGKEYLHDLAAVVDRINVSLNAPDLSSYRRICRPVYDGDAWRHVVGFARYMKDCEVDVWCSAVNIVLSVEELSALREFLRFLEIPLRIR